MKTFILRSLSYTGVYEVTLIPLKDERDKVIQLLGVAIDLTEQKNAEQQIINTERQLKTIYNTVPADLYVHVKN